MKKSAGQVRYFSFKKLYVCLLRLIIRSITYNKPTKIPAPPEKRILIEYASFTCLYDI
jgi:hypothetical protein